MAKKLPFEVIFRNSRLTSDPAVSLLAQIVKADLIFATQAELAGNVALVWLDSSHRIKFLAPPEQHNFFRESNYAGLTAQIIKSLTCGKTRRELWILRIIFYLSPVELELAFLWGKY